MDVKLQIQSTPNPNALKFVLNTVVKTADRVTFKNKEECKDVPLAQALFNIDHVAEVYFFDNYITITQDGQGDWDAIEEKVQATILANIGAHNPDFKLEEKVEKRETSAPTSPELQKVEAILDRTIRPALQMDGGDLKVVGLENNVLRVYYQGACGSCPSSTMGTLKAIESILQDEYDPKITVELDENA